MQFMGTELCDFCFEPSEGNEQCKKCGFTEENYKYLYTKILTPGTVLLGKYIIGRVLKKDVTKVSYIALMANRKKTVINEYLPSQYVKREYGEQTISVIPECKELFFKGASEFAVSVQHRTGEPFFANGTVYCESEYSEEQEANDPVRIDKAEYSEDLFEENEPPKQTKSGARSVLAERLSGDIHFYVQYMDGHTSQGAAGGVTELSYDHSKRQVIYSSSFYGAGVKGSNNTETLDIPKSVATVEGLCTYVKEKNPGWDWMVDSYLNSRPTAVNKDTKPKKHPDDNRFAEIQAGEIKLKETSRISKAQARYTSADGIVDEKIFVPEAPEHSPDRTAHPFVEPTQEIGREEDGIIFEDEAVVQDAHNMNAAENNEPESEKTPSDHESKENIYSERAVYVSPEMVSRFRSAQIPEKKKKKNWLFPAFLIVGATVCVTLVVLIILNM